jgi:hypothetical protein
MTHGRRRRTSLAQTGPNLETLLPDVTLDGKYLFFLMVENNHSKTCWVDSFFSFSENFEGRRSLPKPGGVYIYKPNIDSAIRIH